MENNIKFVSALPKATYLGQVEKIFKDYWCTKLITYNFLVRFLCNTTLKGRPPPPHKFKPLISLLNIKSKQKVILK